MKNAFLLYRRAALEACKVKNTKKVLFFAFSSLIWAKPGKLLGIFLFLLTIPCNAKIQFSGLDLAEDNRLLFTAHSSGGGNVSQSALFYAKLPDRTVSLLSTFPERMELVNGGKTILVQNAFGSQQIPVDGGLPRSFPGFSSFTGRSGSRVETTAASFDGRWLLYVDPSSYARGALILLDGVSGQKRTISYDVERPGRFFPAVWDPLSRGFLYTKGGRLYFYTIGNEAPPPDERYRIIGEGSIPSLHWGTGGTFYYLRGSTVYRIRSAELFARTLYSRFLDLGEIAGKIPFEFDSNFDRFWIAPDGLSMLLCKGGRNIFYYPLGIKDDTQTDFASFPYIIIPRTGSRLNVLWSADGPATVLVSNAAKNSAVSDTLAYRFTSQKSGTAGGAFGVLENPPEADAALSADGKRALFWGKTGLYLYDYRNWKLISKLVSTRVHSCLWLGNDEVVVGGDERIESIRLPVNAANAEPGLQSGTAPVTEQKILCLVNVSRYGFEGNTEGIPAGSGTRRILAYSGNNWYATDGENPWTIIRVSSLRDPAPASSSYRVYLENHDGFFENIPMVRNTASVGTFPLFETGIPAASQNKGGYRGIALCFDLYDDVSGLSAVLEALDRFGVKATFFINGEFIRRHPQAAKELAGSGHEIASMFFAPMDLSDSRYRITSDFIQQGLARNEDEYFKATGKELAVLWHPPFYALSKEIADAAAEAGYRTVTRDIDSRDWMLSGDAKRLNLGELSAADMIDSIMDAKKERPIIPIRLGQLEGGRRDYLFNSLDVLLDALVRDDYEPVPVTTLLRNR